VILVRYFAGTKLGVSGLIEANKETAKCTIYTAKIKEITIKEKYNTKVKLYLVQLWFKG